MSVCSWRIKERLGLGAASNGREPFNKLLERTLGSLTSPSPELSQRVRALIRAWDAWTMYQTNDRLQAVVERVVEIGQVDNLDQLVKAIPSRKLEPTSKASLLNIIGKVSRYREAARVLYRMAKKFPIARDYDVLTVRISEDFFRRPSTTLPSPPPTLASVLKRIQGGTSNAARNKPEREIAQVCRLLRETEQKVNKRFVNQIAKTLKEAKIHAEVQLVHHYDAHNEYPRPRVICSSKDACYLCNAFILSHGKFHVPKCHGRLYPGWRTQAASAASASMNIFVNRLEKQVLDSIRIMLKRQDKISCHTPWESTVLTISHSISTEESSGSSETIRPPEGQSTLSQSHDSAVSLEQARQTEATEIIPQIETAVMVEPVGKKDPATGDDAVDEIISLPPEGLVQDQTVTCELQANGAPQRYYAWPLNLEVEYTVGPGGPIGGESSDMAKVKYSLTWLSDQDKAQIGQSKDAKIIKGDTIKDQIQLDPQDLRNLYISVGKTVLKFEEVQ